MFGGSTTFGSTLGGFGQPKPVGQTLGLGQTTQPQQANPDFEVTAPPEDSVSCLRFSPPSLPQIFLIAGSWDNNVSYLSVT